MLAADGALDRAALASIVFTDPAARARLDAIVHPIVRRLSAEREAAAAVTDHGAVVVHDIPLLVETGQADAFHVLVVVHAPAVLRVERLVRLRGMDRGRGGGAGRGAGERRRAARGRGRRARRHRAATTTCARRWTSSGTGSPSSAPTSSRRRPRDAGPADGLRPVRRADRQRLVAGGAEAGRAVDGAGRSSSCASSRCRSGARASSCGAIAEVEPDLVVCVGEAAGRPRSASSGWR